MDYGLSAFSECFACLEKKFQVWIVCWPNTSPLLYISISHIAVTSVMDTGIYWYLRQDCGKYFIVGKWKYLVQIKISLKWAEWPSSTASISTIYTLECKTIHRFHKAVFTFKTLLRHYAKQALTPRFLNVKLGPQCKSHKGQAVWLA